MTIKLPQSAAFICRSCLRNQNATPQSRAVSTTIQSISRLRNARTITTRTSSRISTINNLRSTITTYPAQSSRHYASAKASNRVDSTENPISNPTVILSSIQSEIARLENATTPPKSGEVLETLERCHKFADLVVYGSAQQPTEADETRNQDPASSTLFALDDKHPAISRSSAKPALKKAQQSPNSLSPTMSEMTLPFREQAVNTLCELIYDLMRDPKIFINPSMLASYTRTQILLGKPEYLPEIFFLYANKPIPTPNSTDPIQYKPSWPNTPKNAIPFSISDAALDAAIAKKDLPLALAIIDTTVATQAFKRNKLIAKGTFPLLMWCTIPATAYAGSHWLSEWQNTWDPSMIKWMAMTGSMAYVGTLSIIAFVAFSTWNDHHERVRWQPGIRLRDRWIKEEERLYLDRIAMAWGFQDKVKRGEETGEEWSALRESIMLRGMVLDQSDLIEGMNP